MISLKKIDEFIKRQGIKSSELCIILDRIEKQIQRLEAKNKVLMEVCREYCNAKYWDITQVDHFDVGKMALEAIKKCEEIDND